MNYLYETIHKLKSMGYSPTDISLETGVSVPAIYRALSAHGVREKATTTFVLINNLLDQVLESLFPADVDQFFHDRDTLLMKLSTKQFCDISERHFLPSIRSHSEYGGKSLASARLYWLEAEIYHDLSRLQNRLRFRDSASAQYQKATDTIENATVEEELNTLKDIALFKLAHNSFAVEHDRLSYEARRAPERIKHLKDLNYITKALSLLEHEPWNWRVARSALAVTSLMQDLEYTELFFEKLLNISEKFADLSYQPSKELAPIADDPDFDFFRTTQAAEVH